jgi:hypothetical protein
MATDRISICGPGKTDPQARPRESLRLASVKNDVFQVTSKNEAACAADALASEAPPCCESVPRLNQSTLKRREGQLMGSLFSMRRQARSEHHLVATGRTGHHSNAGF